MKPAVFNYERYAEAIREAEALKKENEKLKAEIANLQIKCRIMENNYAENKRV